MNGEQDKKKHISYGAVVQKRVKQLLERFLAYANGELENSQRFKIVLKWETKNIVIVRTHLRGLSELSDLTTEQVREALKRLEDFLEILKDERKYEKGLEDWHFRLKFWHDTSDKDRNLQKFDAEWQRLREKLPGVQRPKGRKTQPQPTRYENIPFSGVVEFVGRETELQNLHELLQKNQQVAIAAIAGMGGVGKTELAVQYANSHRVTYQGGICWLSAVQDVGVQLVQFAVNKLQLKPPEELDLFGRVQYCLSNWREGEVLLIIDNVTNYQKEVRRYLESVPSRFKQLITTREKLQPPIVRLDLDVLTPLAAMQLLKSIVGRERLRREALVARRLCKWLGYLPLGLELVGRYLLGDEELSLAEMLQDLEKERLKNPALDEAQTEMTAKLGVAAAFELSWRRLRENAQRLGCVLSLFALAPIPWELVEGITINNEVQNWKQARRELLQLHLLQHKDEGVYQLHPLLRDFFQDKLTGLEQKEEFKRSFCGVMVGVAKGIPYTPTLEKIKNVAPAIPHLAHLANNLLQYISDEDLIWAFLGNAFFYHGQGLYDKAAPWYEKCLKITKQRFGEEHPNVAQSLNNLALLYHSQGKYSEAEPLFIQALALSRKLLGEEHPNVAQSLNNLAELYRSQGKYSEAESLFIQALALSRKLLGEEHPNVAQSLNNLALLYHSQGKYSEAEPLLIQALALSRKLLGEEHPNVANSLNNLAELYRSQGKYSEAESLFIQALALSRKLLGEEHPNVAQSLNNLALLYHSQGKYSEAEPLFIQALALYSQLLGEEHPDVANSLNNLALLYDSQGKYSEAEPLFIQALALRRQLLGEEHPDVALSLNNLAYLYDSQGKYSQAEPLYIQALALRRQLLGEEHPDVAQSLNNLAYLYDSQGKYSQAEPLYIQALALRRQLLGEEHPDVAQSLNNLAYLYNSQGKYSEAESLFIQALALYRQLLGEEHPDVATSLNNLAALYCFQGKYSQVEPLYIQALDILEQRLGENHPNTVTVRNNLASLRQRLNSQPE
ncbi:tetratricopeptide repeat protein [Nostoc sp. CMAA1605]|uniref:tetratricopeptide repeat protein n=1 Tax=Nostoc sp. CMAA1605 TaxID=2055159 RepID=UPI001F408840|nr:tetratricopeptide repeat protein [Nostoc sp. CMAA1605]MCF4968039.1 NB-ARC domain-containing protein [Nostoc sp. CMAA1605]